MNIPYPATKEAIDLGCTCWSILMEGGPATFTVGLDCYMHNVWVLVGATPVSVYTVAPPGFPPARMVDGFTMEDLRHAKAFRWYAPDDY